MSEIYKTCEIHGDLTFDRVILQFDRVTLQVKVICKSCKYKKKTLAKFGMNCEIHGRLTKSECMHTFNAANEKVTLCRYCHLKLAKKALKPAKKYFSTKPRLSPEEKKQRQKIHAQRYHERNRERLKQKYDRECENLEDKYVISTIRSKDFRHLKKADIPPELIELQRDILKFKRAIKELKENEDNHELQV